MSSAGARDWESDCQVVEAPRPQVFAQNDTKRESLQKTPRDGMEHGDGEADTQWKGERITRRHHPGPAGEWSAGQGQQGEGAGVRLMDPIEGVRGPWTGEPWVKQGPGHSLRKARGGNWTGEDRHGSREELLWDAQHGRELQMSG